MSKLNVMVPNPDGSGRYCVYDPVAGRYLRGGVNVSRMQAEQLLRDVRPQTWQECARAAGWLPPDEVAKQLEAAAALTEAALTKAALMTKPEVIQEQPAYHEAPSINSIGPDEL